jgi:hypothetical protein
MAQWQKVELFSSMALEGITQRLLFNVLPWVADLPSAMFEPLDMAIQY